MEINQEDAFEIVITLASENILSEEEASLDPEVLVPERERQLAAIAEVQRAATRQRPCSYWRCLGLGHDPWEDVEE